MDTLTFREFSAYYKVKGQYWMVLDKLDLDVRAGELLVIVGPSGCGKTTLLKSILSQCELTEGELLLQGRPLADIKPEERNIAYISQEYSLYPSMTVYENIAFPLRVMKTAQGEVDRRVREIAGRTGLSLLLSRKPRQLSGGQQQRVAIARALVKNPRLMLFDEPFSNQDKAMRSELRELVKRLQAEQRITTLFVTHDTEEAQVMADRVAVMEDGAIRWAGSPQDYVRRLELGQ